MGPPVCLDGLRMLSYGLYILTSRDGDRLNGQIINTAIQVTSEPPRVAVVVHKMNLTTELIEQSRLFAVCVLAESTPLTFIGLFGFRSGRDIDKFAKTPYRTGVSTCPLVTEHTLAHLEARVTDRMDLGTHIIYIGDLVHSEVQVDGRPMTYRHYHEVLGGKTSRNAPSFMSPR